MKRFFKALLTITLLFGVVGLVSCGGGSDEKKHPHPVEEKWSRDASSHWHACTECDQQVDFAIHTFAEWTLAENECKEKSTCTVCGFTKTKDAEHKYKNGKCTHCGLKEIVVAVGQPIKADEPMAIYVQVPADWTKVNCYYWCDLAVGVQGDGSEIDFEEHVGMWPGLPMTLVDETNHIYGFIIPKYTNMIIFNNGGTPQTVDLELVSSNFYILNETAGGDGKFTVAKYDTYVDESGLKLNQYPSKDVKVEYEYRTIYVKLPAAWTEAKICFWDTTEGTWPEYADLEVVDATNHIYKFTLPTIVRTIILSGGEGLDTEELSLEESKDYFVVTDKDNVEYTTYSNN